MSNAELVSREAAVWAIRLFIGREPVDDAEIEFHRQHPNLESVRRAFSATGEFRDALRRWQQQWDQGYRAPLDLLVPPADRRIPWRFTPPSLSKPTSQLCTSEQLSDPAYASWAAALGLPAAQHRKMWEFCYVASVMADRGVLRPGARALGFGVGRETIPSYLAQCGLRVTATDAPPEAIEGHGWEATGQHAASLEGLHHPAIVAADRFRELVEFRPVDMNDIPADLRGYDVCWSSCCFEHLGSIGHGLDFFVNSLETLKPGGIAVHTTEFNLSSVSETLELENLCLFRKPDIERLLSRLLDAGHEVAPLNLYLGGGEIDRHIDLPPYAMPHLKLEVGRYVTTSIGLIARKAGG